MGIGDKIKGALSSMQDDEARRLLIYGDGELKKADLKYHSTTEGKDKTVQVQFNPTEYSINRGIDLKKQDSIGSDDSIESVQGGKGELATLHLKLMLDTATDMPKHIIKEKAKKYLKSDKELTDILTDLALLTKIDPKNHVPSNIHFVWGSMDFVGKLSSLNISYKMFNRNGLPVRAELDMAIVGEDSAILTAIGSKPKESPDRTKFRMLSQRDELWMLAAEEYDDPSQWKEIAKANGILNPRKVNHTKGLKVPSL